MRCSERSVASSRLAITVTAVVHVFCTTNPSFATSLANGLLAWATVLGGCTAFFSGLLAAVSIFVPVTPQARSNAINKGVGVGFIVGMALGVLTLFVFIARLAP
jgi:hypothetical protein